MVDPRPEDAPGDSSSLALDHVLHNAEVVAAVKAHAERGINRHQRAVEQLTAAIGRPMAIYAVLTVVGAWVTLNVLLHLTGHAPDPPPFFWLQGAVSLAGLMTAIMVLTTQNRQARHAEERAQLDLHVNLAAEQKAAKVVALLEELRRDLPNVRDRKDMVADAMSEAVDPHAVLSVLAETFEAGGDDAGPVEPARGASESGPSKGAPTKVVK